jgi:hypothetical protein
MSTVSSLVEGVLSVPHQGLPTKLRGSHRQNPLQMGCEGAAASALTSARSDQVKRGRATCRWSTAS